MEDEASVAQGLQMVLSEEGYDVDVANTGSSALNAFHQKGFDLLVADLRLPDIDGMEVIRQVKENKPDTEVIVITGYASIDSAVESMKLGAFEYLSKPFTDDQFKQAVDGALKEKKAVPAEKPAVDFETEEGQLIQKREVLRVLDRTAEDPDFWLELMEKGSAALEDYQLSGRAKYAISQGDLNWINENVGELTQKQLMFIYKRLEREAW
ncbi:MAG: response regulator [Desulfobacterales bacterium]|jgi:DNA-binding NtrC family response regulator